MVQRTPAFLLLILLIGLAPWNLLCLSHPSGHNHHHEPGTFSPCQQRVMCMEYSFWPPMDCDRVSADLDYFSGSSNTHFIFPVGILCLHDESFINSVIPENPFLSILNLDNNSDPPPGISQLRAPPFYNS